MNLKLVSLFIGFILPFFELMFNTVFFSGLGSSPDPILKTTIWATISTVLDLVDDNWQITNYIFLLYTAMLISSLVYQEQNQKNK